MQKTNFEDIDNYIDSIAPQIVKAVQEVVRIRSVIDTPSVKMPFGKGIGNALRKTLKIGSDLGFHTINREGYVGIVEYGSENPDDYVAVLGHLDVVDEGTGWRLPPYGGVIEDGKVYGRGTIDNKGPIIAALFALKSIEENKIPLKRKVRIIFGTDEENHSRDIDYYNAHEPQPFKGFTPDANFPAIFAEKGILNFNLISNYRVAESKIKYLKGGNALNCVPSFAEADFDGKKVNATGKTAHASTPEQGENAITKLLCVLGNRWDATSEEVQKLEFLKNYFGCETNGLSLGIKAENETEGNLTLNFGLIEMKAGIITAGIDIRYPSNASYKEILEKIGAMGKLYGFKLENISNDEPLFFPKEDPLVKTLMDVFNDYMGRKDEPLSIGGGTYAKSINNTIAFGAVMPGQVETEHGAEEHIEIQHLITITKIFARAIIKLANLR